ncbi:MAG: 1-deoxy-D-xylulose-5-phosphate synthase [Armatimonadetes bacterium]|nr:1-deoxy-D-xylulose-5-phosphate synthase [Armatimonadota bacterium]
MTRLIERIQYPADLKVLTAEELRQLAEEIRERIVQVVSRTGGHLASSLGAVDLTIALHSVYESPKDRIIWDVGHQAYAHKMLTGRCACFDSLRQYEGISGFPRRSESLHDAFGAGHSSTSISAALGFAKARDLRGTDEKIVAVIGDGALTGGQAMEAFNNAGQLGSKMLVILNDNEMSISPNVGALAMHLSKLRALPLYRRVEDRAKSVVENLPVGGRTLSRTAEGILHGVTRLIGSETGVIFEEMGFTYLGPIDGHDIGLMMEILSAAKTMDGPVMVHVLTTKGKGYEHAEKDSRLWHGTPPFEITNGEAQPSSGDQTYTSAFSDALIELATADERIVAVTAAMPDGTGLSSFAEQFPDRFFDVGIAEPHAVTFAAGLAAAGMRPVVAVYSTFLQRAYDQVLHDVCLQRLPVVFAIDRAGLVGEDGPTHHGVFDLSYLRHMPNLTIAAPSDPVELRAMLVLALEHPGPVAIRYPRGSNPMLPSHDDVSGLALGLSEVIGDGDDVCIVAIGSMVHPALKAREILRESGTSAALVNARYAKPLDSEVITRFARKCRRLVVVEENSASGGFGSAVMELLAEAGVNDVEIRLIGLPDEFAVHGKISVLREHYGLDAEHIAAVAAEATATASRLASS